MRPYIVHAYSKSDREHPAQRTVFPLQRLHEVQGRLGVKRRQRNVAFNIIPRTSVMTAHPFLLSPAGSLLVLLHPGLAPQRGEEAEADEEEEAAAVAGEEEEEEEGLRETGRALGPLLGLAVPLLRYGSADTGERDQGSDTGGSQRAEVREKQTQGRTASGLRRKGAACLLTGGRALPI